MSKESARKQTARSHEQTLRAMFDAWARGDIAAGTELLAEDIRFSAAQPEGQVRADGLAAMRQFNRGFFASWEHWWLELHDLEQYSPVAFLVSGTQHGIGKGSGAHTCMPMFIAIRFRGEQIVQLEFFYSRADALDAGGLGESGRGVLPVASLDLPGSPETGESQPA